MARFIKLMMKLPCFGHLVRRPSSTGLHLPALDGLRAVAALLVLYFHYLGGSAYYAIYGRYGVFLFFALSGFLLVQRFCSKDLAIGFKGTCYFLGQRFLRIYPMFVVSVYAAAWVRGYDSYWIKQTLFFVLSDGWLWTIKQEMVFYLSLPVVAIVFIWLKQPEIQPLLLLIVAFIADYYFNVSPGFMTDWAHGPAPLYICVFFTGMAAGCLAHSTALKQLSESPQGINYSVYIICLLCMYWLWLWHIPYGRDLNIPWTLDMPISITLAATVLLTALFSQSPLRIICMLLPLRMIGIVGYSFYLWHIEILDFVRSHGFGGGHLFWYTLILTYLLSCLSYCLVEAPFMSIGKRFTTRKLAQ